MLDNTMVYGVKYGKEKDVSACVFAILNIVAKYLMMVSETFNRQRQDHADTSVKDIPGKRNKCKVSEANECLVHPENRKEARVADEYESGKEYLSEVNLGQGEVKWRREINSNIH